MGLDPGKTTGWSYFTYDEDNGLKLVDCGQITTNFSKFLGLLDRYDPQAVIYENYRLYPWKLQEQTWSSLQTPRFIGAMEFIFWQRKIPVVHQSASQGKSFCTDAKLKSWGFFQKAKRHANDSIRHVCAYVIFGRWDKGKIEIPPILLEDNPFYDGE